MQFVEQVENPTSILPALEKYLTLVRQCEDFEQRWNSLPWWRKCYEFFSLDQHSPQDELPSHRADILKRIARGNYLNGEVTRVSICFEGLYRELWVDGHPVHTEPVPEIVATIVNGKMTHYINAVTSAFGPPTLNSLGKLAGANLIGRSK